MDDQSRRHLQTLTAVRIALGALLFIHAAARLWLGTVDAFGEFLSNNGIPFGAGMAWFLTLFELCAAVLMAMGRWVSPIALVFTAIYACGVWLDWTRGLFLIGAGWGGMKYSALIIACLLWLVWAHWPARRSR